MESYPPPHVGKQLYGLGVEVSSINLLTEVVPKHATCGEDIRDQVCHVGFQAPHYP